MLLTERLATTLEITADASSKRPNKKKSTPKRPRKEQGQTTRESNPKKTTRPLQAPHS